MYKYIAKMLLFMVVTVSCFLNGFNTVKAGGGKLHSNNTQIDFHLRNDCAGEYITVQSFDIQKCGWVTDFEGTVARGMTESIKVKSPSVVVTLSYISPRRDNMVTHLDYISPEIQVDQGKVYSLKELMKDVEAEESHFYLG